MDNNFIKQSSLINTRIFVHKIVNILTTHLVEVETRWTCELEGRVPDTHVEDSAVLVAPVRAVLRRTARSWGS